MGVAARSLDATNTVGLVGDKLLLGIDAGYQGRDVLSWKCVSAREVDSAVTSNSLFETWWWDNGDRCRDGEVGRNKTLAKEGEDLWIELLASIIFALSSSDRSLLSRRDFSASN